MSELSGLSVERCELREASEDVLRRIHAIRVEREAEWMPDDPTTPFEQWRAGAVAEAAFHRTEMCRLARRGDEIIGWLTSVTWDDHAESGLVSIAVARDHRGAGVGAALLTAGLDDLVAQGRSKVIIDVPKGSPHGPALGRLGLAESLVERISRLRIADLDRDLMAGWVDQAAERAGDYELVNFAGRVPDEYLDRWCQIEEAMNTAPLEDLDLEDATMTPDKWRSIEAVNLERAVHMRALLAVHTPTGQAAGMTKIYAQRYDPAVAEQDDTVVHPEHRNRGLGRWLKAANILAVIEEFGDLEVIYTGNADSNEAMLNINEAMGFERAATFVAWQGPIVAAQAHLNR